MSLIKPFSWLGAMGLCSPLQPWCAQGSLDLLQYSVALKELASVTTGTSSQGHPVRQDGEKLLAFLLLGPGLAIRIKGTQLLS